MAKQLIITCLGGILLEVDSLEITDLSKKAKAIIVYLACNPSEHQREKIADIFWGSSQSKITSARNNLRGQITQLRKALAPYLIFSRETISFNTDAQYRLDVAELNLAVKKYTIPREENYTVSNLVKLQNALSLYQGDFLDGFYLPDAELFEEWAFGQRESLKFTVINGFLHLITGYRILNNYIDGIRWAHRVLEIDPYNETAHSQLIYLLAANGQRGLAIEHFQHYQKKIRQELNIPPGPQIEEIYQQILQADIVPQIVTLDPGLLSSTPYKGLNPFKETDWFDFYGREEFVKRLVKAVYSRPIIAVIGPSGCGKTSVVKAGLLPQLRLNMPLSRKIVHHLDRQFHWLTIEFRPGSQPFHSLASALVPFLSKETTETEILIEAQKLATTLRKKELMLSVVIKRILALKEENNLLTENLMRFPSRILLVINQFEEIFTLCDDPTECQTFIDILLGGIKTFKELTQSDYSIVFTLRADLMGQVLLHRILADALQESTEILGTMTRKELTQAIKSPAQSRGVEFESGLLERILDDVGDSPGNLPLLEFAMTQLWDVRDGNLLRHSGYDNIGQVEGALARYAEHVYNTLSPNEKKLVKAISSQLVNPGEGTEDIRRQTKRSELSGEGWQLVQKLADARLVVTGIDPNGHEIVEIIHEALIHGWARMSA